MKIKQPGTEQNHSFYSSKGGVGRGTKPHRKELTSSPACMLLVQKLPVFKLTWASWFNPAWPDLAGIVCTRLTNPPRLWEAIEEVLIHWVCCSGILYTKSWQEDQMNEESEERLKGITYLLKCEIEDQYWRVNYPLDMLLRGCHADSGIHIYSAIHTLATSNMFLL